MSTPAWFRSLPQAVRWPVGAAIVFAALAATYGFAEAVRDYPIRSWFGVTVYVGMAGGVAGFVAGAVAAFLFVAVRMLLRQVRNQTVQH